MDTIRTALGQLQQDSDSTEAWLALESGVEQQAAKKLPQIHELFTVAKAAHAERHEWWAVARLAALEIAVTPSSATLTDLWREYGDTQLEHLYDEGEAANAFGMVLEATPKDKSVKALLAEREERRSHWEKSAAQYLAEAEGAADDVYKSSMLMRVAEMEIRFGGADVDIDVVEGRLIEACRLDPDNLSACEMLEYLARRAEAWVRLADLLEEVMAKAKAKQTRRLCGLKLARLCVHHLADQTRAAASYQQVLEVLPGSDEASSFLAEYHSQRGAWQELVRVYERRLAGEGEDSADRLGDMLQIALLYSRKLGQAAEAEPWFERVRKLDPANTAMREFFSEHLRKTGDTTRLTAVLQGAERALQAGPEKQAALADLANLQNKEQGAQHSIESYKAQLRQDPANTEVRAKLKALYKEAGSYNALVELLRQQFERTPTEDREQRLSVLKEVSDIYRQHLPGDPALASVLTQIVAIDPEDAAAHRELCVVYERLARWRELLSSQQKLVEVTADSQEKATVLRAMARRWLEQFSNVQNATAAYEALLIVEPKDSEAREQLQELYTKRRAWQQLYDLWAVQAQEDLPVAERVALLKQMASLCAERLARPQEAMQLYREIVSLDAGQGEVVEALERQAERAKDWPTLVEALEKRVKATEGVEAQIALLQKLGAVYADQLNDQDGALGVWRRVVELQPGHTRALRYLREAYLAHNDFDALEQLYASQNDFDGLAEVLGHAAEKTDDIKSKIDLSYRAARIYSESLVQPTRAFRSYERILAADPQDSRAAGELIPIYEQDEKWARLPALYDILVSTSNDPQQKFDYLKKMAHIAAQHLGDRMGSLSYARRAFEAMPDDTDGLTLLEKAASAAGRWDVLAEALSQRLIQLQGDQSTSSDVVSEPPRGQGKKKKQKGKHDNREQEGSTPPPNELVRDISMRLAQVCDAHLQQADRAIELLKTQVQRQATDQEAAAKLEVILRREGKREDLRWLLEQKVSQASVDEQARLLADWALLEEDVFKEAAPAAALYRRLLDLNPGHISALRSLARLLLQVGEFAEVASALARSLSSLTGLERAEVEVQLAQLYLDQLEKPTKALDHAVSALSYGSHDSRAIALLERLVQVAATRERAAQVLAKEYAEVGDARHEVEALQAMLGAAKDPDERFVLLTRLAEIQEHKLDSVNASFDTTLRAVREFPERVELWDRAQDLAARAERAGELAEALRETLSRVQGTQYELDICERAAQLHLEKLGDPAGAVPYLERILKRDPANSGAFAQLKHVLTAEERWGELAELYEVVIANESSSVVQIELLLEVALLCEEITEDLIAAVRYYERIQSIDPVNDLASSALDRLYVRLGKNEELANLLERRIAEVGESEQSALMTRLATLLIEKLHRPADAIVHIGAVLDRDANDTGARELAERLLQLGSLRQQAVSLLERVYESRDEVRDLARVLDVQLTLLQEQDAAKGGKDGEVVERYKETLRRVATLKDARLHDDAGAFAALARFVPLEPLDFDARAQLEEIAGRLQNFSELVEVLTKAELAIEAPEAKAEVLLKAAELCEQKLQDSTRAEALYSRVLSLREHAADSALGAGRALDRIYTQLGRDADLAQVLRTQIELEFSDEAKGDLRARLANVFETRLSKIGQAIAVWHERLDANPADAEALSALDRLYETTGRWAELVPILRQRQEQSVDAQERHTLLVRLARVLADKVGDAAGAILVWVTIVEQVGNDDSAREALEQLYQGAERWEELAESYSSHVEVATSNQARLELWRKLGDVRSAHLSDAQGALDAYREGLVLDSGYAPIRLALQLLLQAEDVAIRREAAGVLRGLYEAERDSVRLLSVLEVQAAATEDPIDKVEVLQLAVRVAEMDVNDVRRAFTFVQQAVIEGAGHVDLKDWLQDLDRLSAAAGERAAQVSLLRQIVDRLFDGDLKYEVLVKIAFLARDELGQTDLAREYFEQAAQQDPSRPEPLLALEAIYQKQGNWSDVLRVLERRIEICATDAERQQLLFYKARLLATELGQAAEATEAYETIITERMDPEAAQALERLYRAQERYSDLVSLIERELDIEPAREAHHRVRIAEILANQLSDMARALDEVESALRASPNFPEAAAFLARVIQRTDLEGEQRGRAAELLEPIYLAAANYDRVLEVLNIRLQTLADPLERRKLLLQLAKLHEEQKEDFHAALETVAQLFQEDIRDEAVGAELERLARVADAKRRLAEIYAKELADAEISDATVAQLARRTGELLAEQGHEERALTFLERALEFEPDNVDLFSMIDRILERLGRHRGRVDLYTKILDQRFDPAERIQLQHAIAVLERGQLRDLSRAIAAYVQVLDIDDRDQVALDALGELYRETERYSDLAEHYLHRAELAETPQAQAEQRLLLARVCRTRLNDTGRAIDQLEEITRIVPQHAAAIADLEALRDAGEHRERVIDILRPIYEESDSWQRLISLNEDRLSLTDDPGDRLSILKDNARLWEQRGQAPESARVVFGNALDLDPDDAEVRQNYERLVEQTQAWSELVERYERLVALPDLIERGEFLGVLVRAYDLHLQDARNALSAALKMIELDPSQSEMIDKAVTFATLLGDWTALVQLLEVKVDLQTSDASRAAIWHEVATLQHDMLDNIAAAVEAAERTLDVEPSNLAWLDFLISLHRKHDQPERLVELCQQRLEATTPEDSQHRYEMLLIMAEAYYARLNDPLSAAERLEQALAERPGDAAALEQLAGLHKSQQAWPEYLQVLSRLAEGATEEREKTRFLKESAVVLLAELNDPVQALQTHRQVLVILPTDEESLAAALQIGRNHESERAAAAELLVPLFNDERHAPRLVEILELRLSVETDVLARVITLRQIADVKEHRLKDMAGAQQSLLTAADETPDNAELHTEIERLCGVTASWTDYATMLEERAGATFDAAVGRDLWLRLGRVAEEKLHDSKRAIAAYTRAMEQGGDLPELLSVLDRLYGAIDDSEKLLDILERRLAFAAQGPEQAQLHFRMAQLHREKFQEPSRALSSLKQSLDASPDQAGVVEELEQLADLKELFEEASETLESVYRRRGQTDRLAGLYERRVSFAQTPSARSEVRQRLATVLDQELGDAAAAQRVLQQGLSESPSDGELLSHLEAVLSKTNDYQSAAAALEQAVASSSGLSSSVARDLYLRAAHWYRDQAHNAPAALKALHAALEQDPSNDQVLQEIDSLQRTAGDNRGLIETLQQRARLQDDAALRESLYRQVVDLAQAEQPEIAESALRELLKQEEDNAWALSSLQQRCEALGDYKEAFTLLERRTALASQPEEIATLRHQAALIAKDKLRADKIAMGLYAQLFESNVNDEVAASALCELYADKKKWAELREVLQKLIEAAVTPETRIRLRLELAELCQSKLDDVQAASESLRGVLLDDAGHSEAVTLLSALYEKAGQHQQQAQLLEQQIAVADARSDGAAVLRFRSALADLQENRLKDRSSAITTLEAILSREPSQQASLQSLVRLLRLEDRTSDVVVRLRQLVDLSAAREALPLIEEMAEAQRKLGDTAGEIETLEKGLSLDRNQGVFGAQLLVAYEKAGRWESLAALIADNAKAAASNDQKVLLLRQAAKVHLDKRHDPAAAAEMLAKASEINPSDRELMLALCDAYTKSGRADESVRVLEQIVESFAGRRSKELVDVHQRLAAAYHSSGRTDQAIAELDKAFRIEPGNMAVLKELGLLALSVGDTKKAQQMFRALLLQKFEGETPISKAEVFFYLSQIHEKAGEAPKALQMAERAVQTDPTLQMAIDLVTRLKG